MFDSRSRIAPVLALLLLGAITACEDSGPASPGDPLALSGTYAATLGAGTRYGAVTFTTGIEGPSRDLVAEGATILLDLHADGTTTGRLFVPAGDGAEELDADLAGTWTEEDGIVRLAHPADTFLRDMELVQDGDRLVGEDAFGAVEVQVTLEPVSEEAIEHLGHDIEEFEVVAAVDVMESFPVQLGGSMTFRNHEDEPRTLVTGVCWPLLRVYDRDSDVVIWDQLEEGACALFTPQVDVVAAGDSIRFQTPTASAADILDDEHPDGIYRVAVYFSTVRTGEFEIEVGEVELAIPR